MSEFWYYSDLDHNPPAQPEDNEPTTEQKGDNPAMPSFKTVTDKTTTPPSDN